MARLTPRAAFLLVAVLAAVGSAAELAAERHWDGFTQRIPWVTIGLVLAGVLAELFAPARATRMAVRLGAVVIFAASAFGIYEHVEENHTAGPLDFRYADTWDSLSAADQWWKAATKEVGPAPPVAPGAVAFAALALLLATLPWSHGDRARE